MPSRWFEAVPHAHLDLDDAIEIYRGRSPASHMNFHTGDVQDELTIEPKWI